MVRRNPCPIHRLTRANPSMIIAEVDDDAASASFYELSASSPLELPPVAPVERIPQRIIRDVRRHSPVIPRCMRADTRQQIPPIRIAMAERMRSHIAIVEATVEAGEPGEIRVDRAQDAAVGLLVDSGADVVECVGGGVDHQPE